MLDVLVVDDSDLIRRMILKTLVLAEVPTGETYEAGNGREALDIMRHNPVGLVLADINMPVMDGVEMVGRMRATERLAAVPVIMVSTEGSTERMEELRRLGVTAYLRKPFTPEALRTVVTSTTYHWLHDERTSRQEMLEDVVSRVLERFAFMWGEVVDTGSMPEPDGDLLVARLAVSGIICGEFELAAQMGLCTEMAVNILGEDLAEGSHREAAADALGETLNMIAGRVATTLTCGAIDRLEPPVVMRLSQRGWQLMARRAGSMMFSVDGRPALLSLGLRAAD